MKRSPGCTSRESIVTRSGPGDTFSSRRAVRTSRTPAASATSSGDQSRTQRLTRDGDVVERQLAPARELLALLVALARDDDDVARPGERDGALDRGVAVDDRLGGATVLDPGEDLVDDRRRVLGARVVRRDDRLVGQARGDLAHLRALAAVAVAAAAEDAEQAAGRQRARRREHVLQRVGRVRVVDEDGAVL